MLKKIVIFFIFISFSPLSFAQILTARVDKVGFSINSPGQIYVEFLDATTGLSITVPNLAGCTSNLGLAFESTWPFYKETVAALITSKALKQTVKVTLSDTLCSTSGYPKVDGIDF